MTRRQQRMLAVAAVVVGVGVAVALGLVAFRKNLMGFYTPSDVVAGALPAGTALQLGGLVAAGSLVRGEGLQVQFVMADCLHQVRVRYDGVLPDLFREGQGAIATGRLDADHELVATQILAKHDENYMPPNMAKSVATVSGQHSCAPFKSVLGAPAAAPGQS